MIQKLKFYLKRIKQGRLQEMVHQTRWIYGYARRYWKIMLLYTALGMAGTGIGILSSFVSRDLVNIITGYRSGELVKTFAAMIGLGLTTTVVGQFTSYVSAKISMKVDADIKADLFEKILVTDWESLTNYHTGDLLTRWSSDAGIISMGVLNYLPDLVVCLVRFVSVFVVVLVNDASFLIFTFLGVPVSMLLFRTLTNRMIRNNQRSAAMGARMSGFNQEAFSNIQIIKAFDLTEHYAQRLRRNQQDFIHMKMDFQKMSMGTSVLLSAVGMVISYCAYGWGIYRVWSGAIDYGTMTMFLGLSGTLTGAMHNLTSMIPNAINLTTSAGRLMDIVEMPRDNQELRGATADFVEEHRESGIGVLAENITYEYATGTRVFEHAHLKAAPHEIVGIVGPSGEGKSTLMRLLLALVTPKEGELYLTSGEARIQLTAGARPFFSYVPQGNTMFSGTIAENMRNVKEDATDEEIVHALELACAWEFVSKLPEGINSRIQERGGGFSEGQAQRLAIARALLRDSPILLLDEATSALDGRTERRMLQNIMQDPRPRTCIVTTHRPTVLGMCTAVYAIRDRKIEKLTADRVQELQNT